MKLYWNCEDNRIYYIDEKGRGNVLEHGCGEYFWELSWWNEDQMKKYPETYFYIGRIK